MVAALASGGRLLLGTVRDILPIVLVTGFFQLVVIRQPIDNFADIAIGLIFVLLGLTIFIQGLETALFPIGESLAGAFAQKGNVPWLLLFAFGLGFGTTVAEPALIAVCDEAAKTMAAAGALESTNDAMANFALALRYTVAAAVGTSIVIGVLRILVGWPIQWLIIGGYVIVVVLTAFAPTEIIGIAYDSGGVTTSTITVPLVTALGVGLARSIRGRNPMVEGFGLIAFASLAPIIFVLIFGLAV
ncbi:MAG: DUF1538 domain-containing protein [Pseudomonadota bacterium]